ncbi:MAG: type III-B CRISPR module RAMP protein Cmr6 [Desulfovibrionales bacterium]|nr:MAG: type III-B CRISPR module RAMP protein Cmr6 [Desulfovibrionales bacterium]
MEYEMTPATRHVSLDVNRIIGEIPNGNFNYGLYFNKWLYVADHSRLKNPGRWDRDRTKDLTCPTDDQTTVAKKFDYCKPNVHLDNLSVSISLFNGDNSYLRPFPDEKNGKYNAQLKSQQVKNSWERGTAAQLLAEKNARLDAVTSTYQQLGFTEIRIEAALASSLVIGLGGEHPTEKGFKFDWNLGIPFIPASSLKGVVRLAFLVNRLNELQGLEKAKQFWQAVVGGLLPDTARNLFGCGVVGKEQEACRGNVIFMDAWPQTMPRLKAEIMNCHYPEYLNSKAGRGPTEDQQLNPQKFWAVDTHDDKGKPLLFVFRALLSPAAQEMEKEFEAALRSALNEHGLGAKTAIGHGRFGTGSHNQQDASGNSSKGQPALANENHTPPPSRSIAPPEKDPDAQRQEDVAAFKSALPRPDALAGQIDSLLGAIRARGDAETRKQCCQALLELAQTNKKKFKSAVKDQKAWAVKLTELCVESGVEVS